jgi:uncharacterized membrane protein YbjE (DUF340 family)
MLQMIQILILLAFLLAGALAVSLRLAPKPRIVEISITVALWLLLFSMGFRIGNNPELVRSIGTIGLLGLVAAACTIAGSCLVVWLLSRLLPRAGSFRKQQSAVAASFVSMEPGDGKGGRPAASLLLRLKPPAILLAVVLAGFVAGILLPELGFDPGIITEWTLNALLFLIGMQFRQSNIPLAAMLKSPAVVALPLATAAGSLLGGILLAPLFSLPLTRALALASGFGWYSLSGVLISNLGDPLLGSSAFLANMIRESLGLILIPVLGQTRVPVMAISVAGATSMDVSLPLIEQTLGPEAVPLSFISGALLSALVPVLVPLFMKL